MRKLAIALIPLLILALVLGAIGCDGGNGGETATPTPTPTTNDLTGLAVQHMVDYLLANYNSTIGLVRERPNDNPSVYWLYSDNYLASLALKEAAPKISNAITEAMGIYMWIYELSPLERWHVLSGEAVSDDVFAIGTMNADVVEKDDKKVRSEIPIPDSHMNDWREYADRVLLAAINAFNRSDKEEARSLFETAQGLFDGTGFKDKAFTKHGYYDTYKLALYLIAAQRLGAQISERQDIVSLILSLQENDPASNRYGGVYTEYDGSGRPLPDADANTETTALALLALK